MVGWLRGHETVRFTGTDDFVPVRLVDFQQARSNRLVVSTEVIYRPGTEERRYNLVLWVNGSPIVIGEAKTPVRVTSWLNAAGDILTAFDVKTPGFFVPMSFPLRPRARSSATGLSDSPL